MSVTRHKLARILPDIPRNFVIAQWRARDFANPAAKYRKLGFDPIWRILTGFTPAAANRAVNWHRQWDGIGIGTYIYQPWMNSPTDGHSLDHRLAMSVGVPIAGQVAWNVTPVEIGAKRMVRVLGPRWSATAQIPAWGVRSIQYRPVSIKDKNTDHGSTKRMVPLLALPKNGKMMVGGAPFTVHAKQCVSVGPEQSAPKIEVNRPARGLLFLQSTASSDVKKIHHVGQWKHYRPYGVVIANYHVRYADGKQRDVPVSFGWNVMPWNCDYRARILEGVTGYWAGFTKKQAGATKPNATLFAMPWVNPRPDVPIASVTLQGTKPNAHTTLFAVTAVTGAE